LLKDKAQKVGELKQKLSVLREQRNKLNTEARGWAEKRNKLNEQVKNLRIEIRELRTERDELNIKVKELKQLRGKTKIEIRERIEEIKKLNQQIKAIAKKKPSRSLETLQKKLDEIEWEIQTTSLSLQEEKELIDHVGQLETQVNIHKKLEMAHQKMLESQSELNAIETQNKFYHKKITETAHKSQKVHNKMLEKINKVRELEMEADNMHQEFLKTRQKTKPLQEEITKILNQIKLLKVEIRREEEKEKKKSEEAIRKKIEEKAKEKLKRGEKLTWEEFQILTEKGKTTQD
jgi:uncharacterized coiled-coil DUF342 family protein